MTTFVFEELVNDPPATVLSAALGAGTGELDSSTDIGKGVKLSTANNYIICAAGDEIEGVITSVEPWTVNDGYSFGGVQVDRRIVGTVGASDIGTLDIGELAVADTQAAFGTAGGLVVQSGTPANFKWRCIRHITGTGATGDSVLLERV